MPYGMGRAASEAVVNVCGTHVATRQDSRKAAAAATSPRCVLRQTLGGAGARGP